jgi:threonine synthase
MYTIRCRSCRQTVTDETFRTSCPSCGGGLEFAYPDAAWKPEANSRTMWRYKDLLPVRPHELLVTLSEGGTPLDRPVLYPDIDLYIKDETRNPTGSHKDRAMSIAVTKAVTFGRDTVMLESDGSTALASAAYAARAGLRSIVVVGRGVPDYRLLPLVVYGSHILEYQGTPAQALDWVHEVCRKLDIYETSTFRLANPYTMEGPKTIGYEIYEQLGRAPDWIVVPVGGGATLEGIGRAFADLHAWGKVGRRPRMAGVLTRGYDMLNEALQRGIASDDELRAMAPDPGPETIQVKIAMTYAPDGLEAMAAVRDSAGCFVSVSDPEALAAQQVLGKLGIYAEPSSAVALAGVEKLRSMKHIREGESVVAVVTGSGFRETGTLAGRVQCQRTPVDAACGVAVIDNLLGR